MAYGQNAPSCDTLKFRNFTICIFVTGSIAEYIGPVQVFRNE